MKENSLNKSKTISGLGVIGFSHFGQPAIIGKGSAGAVNFMLALGLKVSLRSSGKREML